MKEEISSACGPENTAQENSKRPDALTGCADPSLREAQSEKSATESKRPDALSGMVTHAMRMMAGTLLSRVLGLIREMLTAALFGATRQLDAFFVAYTIANLARQLLAEGALSASFVPVFSRVLETEGNVRARKLANEAVSVLMCGCALVIIAGILFSPVIVGIIAPGFAPDEKALAVALSRAMFPFLLLVSAAALAMGVLNSMGCFFIPSIAPALSNLAYILFLLASRRHLSVWNLAMAVLLGGFCHMMLQVIWCSRLKMPLRPVMPRRDDTQLRSMMALFLPYAAGLSLNQLNPVISRMLGSFLSAGSISVLTY
ncbi:MAG: murein biosynthesis integral membrane protein MurJ, partial [Synergistes sp.]|nr:murein biosynthesis integral membrane protein MurJ [Synergistes sp.]